MNTKQVERLLREQFPLPIPSDRMRRGLLSEVRRREAARPGSRPPGAGLPARLGTVAALFLFAIIVGVLITRPRGSGQAAGPAAQARVEADARVRHWIEKLRSDNVQERNEARKQLRGFGPIALPELAKAAHDRDPEVSGAAREIRRIIEISGMLTATMLRVMPGIVEHLAGGDDHAWTRAVIDAAAVDSSGRRTHPELGEEDLNPLLERAVRGVQTPPERLELCQAIVRAGLRRGSPELVKLLSDDDAMLRWQGTELVRKQALAAAIPALRALLKDPEPSIRGCAIRAVGELGDQESIPELRRLLSDRAVSGEAAQALAGLGATDAVPEILEILDRGDAAARAGALRALARMHSRGAISKIIDQLSHPDATVRFDAVQALRDLDAQEAVSEILRRLRQEPPDGTVWIGALGALGARAAIPELIRCLRSPKSGDRMEAATALGRLGAVEAATDLARLLNDPERLVRTNALLALQAIRASSAVSAIALLLQDPQADIRRTCLGVLRELQARETAPQVRALLGDVVDDNRIEAAATLGEWGLEDPAPCLEQYLKSRNPETRRLAAIRLGEAGNRKMVPVLLPLLRDEYDLARLAAAIGLCRLGSDKGVPTLLRLASAEPPETAYPWSMIHLNLLRQPEAWMKLGKRISVELRGSHAEILSMVSKEAGLPLVGLEDLAGKNQVWLTLPAKLWRRNPGQPALDVLMHVLEHSPLSAVVESDRIRILPLGDALAEWTSWWEQRTPRKEN